MPDGLYIHADDRSLRFQWPLLHSNAEARIWCDRCCGILHITFALPGEHLTPIRYILGTMGGSFAGHRGAGRGAAWSYDETMAGFALYYLLTDRQRNDKANPEILRLARVLHRSGGSVYMKLMNLRSCDPNAMAHGTKGLRHASKHEPEMWERYRQEGDVFLLRCLQTLAGFEIADGVPSARTGIYADNARRAVEDAGEDIPANDSIVESVTRKLVLGEKSPEGTERVATVMTRVNQSYFRNTLVRNYLDTCCLTGIHLDPLLIASHIKPWKASTGFEKTNAANGLLLNAFHDKAFDRGLLTIDDDYRVHISPSVAHNPPNDQWLFRFEGARITVPAVNPPSHEFIEYHNEHVFIGA